MNNQSKSRMCSFQDLPNLKNFSFVNPNFDQKKLTQVNSKLNARQASLIWNQPMPSRIFVSFPGDHSQCELNTESDWHQNHLECCLQKPLQSSMSNHNQLNDCTCKIHCRNQSTRHNFNEDATSKKLEISRVFLQELIKAGSERKHCVCFQFVNTTRASLNKRKATLVQYKSKFTPSSMSIYNIRNFPCDFKSSSKQNAHSSRDQSLLDIRSPSHNTLQKQTNHVLQFDAPEVDNKFTSRLPSTLLTQIDSSSEFLGYNSLEDQKYMKKLPVNTLFHNTAIIALKASHSSAEVYETIFDFWFKDFKSTNIFNHFGTSRETKPHSSSFKKLSSIPKPQTLKLQLDKELRKDHPKSNALTQMFKNSAPLIRIKTPIKKKLTYTPHLHGLVIDETHPICQNVQIDCTTNILTQNAEFLGHGTVIMSPQHLALILCPEIVQSIGRSLQLFLNESHRYSFATVFFVGCLYDFDLNAVNELLILIDGYRNSAVAANSKTTIRVDALTNWNELSLELEDNNRQRMHSVCKLLRLYKSKAKEIDYLIETAIFSSQKLTFWDALKLISQQEQSQTLFLKHLLC